MTGPLPPDLSAPVVVGRANNRVAGSPMGFLVVAAADADARFLDAAAVVGAGVIRVAIPRIHRLNYLEHLEALSGSWPAGPVSINLRGAERPGSQEDILRSLHGSADPQNDYPDFVSPGMLWLTDPRDTVMGGAHLPLGALWSGDPSARSGNQIVAFVPLRSDVSPTDVAAEFGFDYCDADGLESEPAAPLPPLNGAVSAFLPTAHGPFMACGYESLRTGFEYLVLCRGELDGGEVRVHVHAQCLAGDVFASATCGCRGQLAEALEAVVRDECGVIVHHKAPGQWQCPSETAFGRDADAETGEILGDLGVRMATLTSNRRIDGEVVRSARARAIRGDRDAQWRY